MKTLRQLNTKQLKARQLRLIGKIIDLEEQLKYVSRKERISIEDKIYNLELDIQFINDLIKEQELN